MTTEEILYILNRHKREMQERFNAETIGLFGSYLINEQNKQSDIDLLVSFRKGHKDLFNFLNLKFYLEDLLGENVDLVNKDGIKPALKSRILKQVTYV
jgi:predicted nucleotidyltransferase